MPTAYGSVGGWKCGQQWQMGKKNGARSFLVGQSEGDVSCSSSRLAHSETRMTSFSGGGYKVVGVTVLISHFSWISLGYYVTFPIRTYVELPHDMAKSKSESMMYRGRKWGGRESQHPPAAGARKAARAPGVPVAQGGRLRYNTGYLRKSTVTRVRLKIISD